MRLPLLAAAALCALAAPAAAQQMTLNMRDGLVTLDAKNVSVRQILTEWARVGRVVVVNGDKLSGTPVTLMLSGVYERQALDTILRGVAGYVASTRTDAPTPEQARFDKLVILPTSAAPAPPPPGPAGAAMRAPQFQPAPQVPDQDDGFDENDDNAGARPQVFQPGMGGVMQRPVGGFQMSPAIPQLPPGALPRFQPNVNVAPGQTVPLQTAPASPFGTTTSGAPGSVAPPPPPSAIPISPTNPGVPPPTGSGPVSR